MLSWMRDLFRRPARGGRRANRRHAWRSRAFRPGLEGLEDRTNPSFFTSPAFAVGSSPHGEAVGDFNGDGKADLAVVNEGSNTVSILLGNGDGTFRPKTDFATGTNPARHNIYDFLTRDPRSYMPLLSSAHIGDFERFLNAEPRLHGYVGGSSAERFPIEASVTEAARAFRAVRLPKPK